VAFNTNWILPGILVFLVFTSKNILIFNEETLILISFLGFLYFSYTNLSDDATAFFQARRDAIQLESENYIRLKEESLQELLTEHEKQIYYQEFLFDKLCSFYEQELAGVGKAYEESFPRMSTAQISQKLKTLLLMKQGFQEKLQQALKQGLRGAVIEKYQKSKKKYRPVFVAKAIQEIQAQSKQLAL